MIKKPDWLKKFNVLIVDESSTNEPGSTGSNWKLHYNIELFNLSCDHFKITIPNFGETFRNFPIKKGDLLMGGCGYGRIAGINYVINNGGDFLVRIKDKAFKIMKNENEEFYLHEHFQKLEYGEVGDFDVFYKTSRNQFRPLCLCATKKSPEAAVCLKKFALKEMKKKQKTLNGETIELHEYIFVITSVKKNV